MLHVVSLCCVVDILYFDGKLSGTVVVVEKEKALRPPAAKKVHFFLAFPSTILVKLGGFYFFVLTYVSPRSPLPVASCELSILAHVSALSDDPITSQCAMYVDACILYLVFVFFTHVIIYIYILCDVSFYLR
jgi:hypothetical protein